LKQKSKEIAMALLQEIQKEIMSSNSDVGLILLKLRYLAAQLGSGLLEEWVKHETEGYPSSVDVPEYRIAEVSYSGTFTSMHNILNDVPIPSYLIEKHAGKSWTKYQIRDSIAAIESTITRQSEKNTGKFGISASNLILILQGKIYEDHSIISISGVFGASPFISIQNAVKARILDLTINLEKSVPVSSLIEIGSKSDKITAANTAHTTIITNNIINGIQNNVGAHGGVVNFAVSVGDSVSLSNWLTKSGIPAADSREVAQLAELEKPEGSDKPFGSKVAAWMKEKLEKGVSGAFEVGKDVAKDILVAGLKGYYGLE
jgi:hypothetical protein